MAGSGVGTVRVDISPGELIDKITILEIKAARIADGGKRGNVERELALLLAAKRRHLPPSPELDRLAGELKRLNEALWAIEDDIRRLERDGDFGEAFVRLARSVYRTNDERSAVKRRINELLGSAIVEEKSYTSY
jgi:hypothetical protein